MFWRLGSDELEPSRGRDRLVERGVDAARARIDEGGQGVRVGALELRQLAVLQDLPGQRVPERQLLQHVHVGRVARLGALDGGELELLEEHRRELLRRVGVDRLAGQLVDLPEERVELRVELLREPGEPLGIDADPDPLHVGQDADERHLERLVQALEAVLGEQGRLAQGEPPHALGPGAGPRGDPRRVRVPCRGPLEEGRERSGDGRAARLGAQLVQGIAAPTGVEEVGGDRRVVESGRGPRRHPRRAPTRRGASCRVPPAASRRAAPASPRGRRRPPPARTRPRRGG